MNARVILVLALGFALSSGMIMLGWALSRFLDYLGHEPYAAKPKDHRQP